MMAPALTIMYACLFMYCIMHCRQRRQHLMQQQNHFTKALPSPHFLTLRSKYSMIERMNWTRARMNEPKAREPM